MREDCSHQRKKEFIYKKQCIYCYMFKLQSPSKSSPFDAVLLSRCFSAAQTVFELVNLMPFSASTVFCFTSSTLAKRFPLRSFFIWETKKKLLGARSGEWGVQHGDHAVFGQKLMNTQSARCGQVRSYISYQATGNRAESLKRFTKAERSRSLSTPPAGPR